jgi:hypothetical protein
MRLDGQYSEAWVRILPGSALSALFLLVNHPLSAPYSGHHVEGTLLRQFAGTPKQLAPGKSVALLVPKVFPGAPILAG